MADYEIRYDTASSEETKELEGSVAKLFNNYKLSAKGKVYVTTYNRGGVRLRGEIINIEATTKPPAGTALKLNLIESTATLKLEDTVYKLERKS